MSKVKERWAETWELLGIAGTASIAAGGAALDELCRRYEEPHRHYHDLDHILDCLRQAARSRHVQARPGLVDLALWYHDVVYDPRRGDNEAKSADCAAAALGDWLDAADLAAVKDMILDTRHDEAPRSADGAIVRDIDLSILGRSPERFRAYDEAIRREYAWVPVNLYRQRRAQLLQSFLDRPQIFVSRFFLERYEYRARANLAEALKELSKGG